MNIQVLHVLSEVDFDVLNTTWGRYRYFTPQINTLLMCWNGIQGCVVSCLINY